MKRFLVCTLLVFYALSVCSCSRSYEDGFAAGYQAAMSATTEAAQQTPQPTSPNLVPHSQPDTGHVFSDIDSESFAPVAPLTIETIGTTGYYFVLVPLELYPQDQLESTKILARVVARNNRVRLYIRGGESAELKIPLGEYAVYYAQGSTWYGESQLFGPDTKYYTCSQTFTFKSTDSGIEGWTLSLRPTENGNLRSSEIDSSEFPGRDTP